MADRFGLEETRRYFALQKAAVALVRGIADDEGIDRNYAAHFAFIDHLFGTAHQADRPWPNGYGVVGDYVPDGFWKQLAFPFTWKPQQPSSSAPTSSS